MGQALWLATTTFTIRAVNSTHSVANATCSMSGKVLADCASDPQQQAAASTAESQPSPQATMASTPSLRRISSPKSDEEWANFLEQWVIRGLHSTVF